MSARRYERSQERVSTRAGSYERKLETKAGEVTLRMPKLRSVPFETAIIDRYTLHDHDWKTPATSSNVLRRMRDCEGDF